MNSLTPTNNYLKIKQGNHMENLPNNTETTNESTGWENMDEGLQPIIDVDQSRTEIEATPEDYEHFAKNRFTKLLNALENPETNIDALSEQNITDQITVVADLLTNLNQPESEQDQTQSKDIFGQLSDKYHADFAKNRDLGHTRIAALNQRLANAADILHNQFDEYVTDLKPKSADSLGGDVIS